MVKLSQIFFQFQTFAFVFVIIIWSLSACKSNNPCKERVTYANILTNNHLNVDSLLTPPDSLEIKALLSLWKNQKYSSDSAKVIKHTTFKLSRKLQIIEQFYGGQKHYGAVILPKNYDPGKKFPALLWADGLNQQDPVVNLNRNFIVSQLVGGLENHFILIPSFRGQALKVGIAYYCSDGFFGDAFDGATSDALYFLNQALELNTNIDHSRIAIYGVSRGGNIALLAAARFPGFSFAIAQSPPTDFIQTDAYQRHTLQFKYQFLSHPLSPEVIRNKLIASSPVYFIHHIKCPILLIHGKRDKICPVSHSTRIIDELKDSPSFEFKLMDEGHLLNEAPYVLRKIKARHQ
jgi:dipeptidyl aminopeptidase/acylaminoacyl peptidase